MYYIPQTTKSSCGFACLKMLLAMMQKDESYLYLPEDEKHGPYSYLQLSSLAQKYGVTLLGAKYDSKDDLKHGQRLPMILTVTGPNASPHAILITKIIGGRVKIYDPGQGVYWKKISDLIKIWDGTALAVSHVEKCPYPGQVIDIRNNKSDVISYILQMMAAVFIALATFFIKPEGPYLLPIIFCFLSALSEILLRFHLMKNMQRCDKYLRKLIPYVNKKEYFEYYKRSQEFKKSSLSMGLNFIFYILVIVLVVVVTVINSLTYIIPIFMAFLSAVIDVFVFSPLKRNIEKDLETQEEGLKKVNDGDQLEMKVKTMEVKAYRYAYIEFARKVVLGAFFLLSGIIVGLWNHEFAITNLVFVICVSALLCQYLTPLLSYDYRVSENKMNKVRFNNVVHPLDEIDSKKR